MEARQEIADFVAAVFFVYGLCVIAWIVASFVFALGVRVPYNRVANGILDFLRDVSEPYLRIFRRFLPPFGALDLSPMIAIFSLFILDFVIQSILDRFH
jgi:YggT family protein